MSLCDTPEVINLTDIQKLRDECLRLTTQNNMLMDARRADAREYQMMYRANCKFFDVMKRVSSELESVKQQYRTDHDNHDPYWRGVRIGLETAINIFEESKA